MERSVFSASVNGREYTFTCRASIRKREGLVHFCTDDMGRTTRVVWCNRTWEEWTFKTVLERAIDKCPREDRMGLYRAIIQKEGERVEKESAEMLQSFERLYSGLSPRNKEIMKNYPLIQTEEDARACMGLMGLLSLMQG